MASTSTVRSPHHSKYFMRPVIPKEHGEVDSRVVIQNIPPGVTEYQLYQNLSKHGGVRIHLYVPGSPYNCGWAWVSYENTTKAIKMTTMAADRKTERENEEIEMKAKTTVDATKIDSSRSKLLTAQEQEEADIVAALSALDAPTVGEDKEKRASGSEKSTEAGETNENEEQEEQGACSSASSLRVFIEPLKKGGGTSEKTSFKKSAFGEKDFHGSHDYNGSNDITHEQGYFHPSHELSTDTGSFSEQPSDGGMSFPSENSRIERGEATSYSNSDTDDLPLACPSPASSHQHPETATAASECVTTPTTPVFSRTIRSLPNSIGDDHFSDDSSADESMVGEDSE